MQFAKFYLLTTLAKTQTILPLSRKLTAWTSPSNSILFSFSCFFIARFSNYLFLTLALTFIHKDFTLI